MSAALKSLDVRKNKASEASGTVVGDKIPTGCYKPRRHRVKGRYASDILNTISTAIIFNMAILLVGESGCGKSALVQTLAKQKNVEVVRVDGSGNLTEDELLGCTTIVPGENGAMNVVFKDGILTDAVRNGKWVIIEEINGIKASVRLAFHSVLEDNGFLTLPHTGEVVHKHNNFRFFGTMNPVSVQYAGTQRDNFAFKDRFIAISIPYVDPDVEVAILKDYFGYNDSFPSIDKISEALTYLCEFAENQRDSYSNGDGTDIPVTTRKLIQIVQFAHIFPISTAMLQLFKGLADSATAKHLTDNLHRLIKQGSDLDEVFLKYGKHMVSRNPGASLAMLKKGEHKVRSSFSTPSEAIADMSNKVNYFTLAYNFSYQEVYDDLLVSEFDAMNIEGAREFMESRNL